MKQDWYMRCPYCDKLVHSRESCHIERCNELPHVDPATDEILWCFSCGKREGVTYSRNQRNRVDGARCTQCVQAGLRRRYEPFRHRFAQVWGEPSNLPEEQLNRLVGILDLKGIKLLLKSTGLDVNLCPQNHYPVSINGKLRFARAYDSEGGFYRADTLSPLCVCVFAISNCMLGHAERQTLCDIAAFLVQRGAKVDEAVALFERRYGSVWVANCPFRMMIQILRASQHVLSLRLR